MEAAAIKNKIKETCIHWPRKIMHEVYEIEPNSRLATVYLFVEVNYPEFNEEDAYFIWEHAHDSDDRLLMYIND